MQIRRNPYTYATWLGGELGIISPRDGRSRIAIGHGVVRLVSQLDEWTTVDDVLARYADGDEPRLLNVIDQLVEHDVLLTCVNHLRPGEAQAPWTDWGGVARLFHRHARDAPYLTDPEEKSAYAKTLAERDLPPAGKSIDGADVLPMPRRLMRGDRPFEEVLFARRTHRQFTPEPMSVAELATLLHWVFAPQEFADGEDFGTVELRTSPNGGARHETEAYIVAYDVEDVPPGTYHYNGRAHVLERMGDPIERDELRHLTYNSRVPATAPVVVLVSAVIERISYKYRDGRAYRLWMYNVGHVGQTFALTATCLGLGAFQTAAFRDSEVDKRLGLDGENEFVSYVLACGRVESLSRPRDVAPATPQKEGSR